MEGEEKIRILVVGAVPIAEKNTVFYLRDGYYVSEDESIAIKSTNNTGKYFKPMDDGRKHC